MQHMTSLTVVLELVFVTIAPVLIAAIVTGLVTTRADGTFLTFLALLVERPSIAPTSLFTILVSCGLSLVLPSMI